jgi:hypothetical protein
MTTKQVATNIKSAFDRIRAGMVDIERGITDVANGVRAVIEIHGATARDVLQSEFPGVPSSFWRSIIAVASGKLHPRVVATGCGGIRYLERLSIEDQGRAVNDGVPVVIPGTDDHRLVPAYLLSPQEINRAIGPDGELRTMAEQAAFERAEADALAKRRQEYLESMRTEPAEEPTEEAKAIVWRVEKNRVHILACPLRLTKSDLRKLLRSIE